MTPVTIGSPPHLTTAGCSVTRSLLPWHLVALLGNRLLTEEVLGERRIYA
jgi:hypothetical protein